LKENFDRFNFAIHKEKEMADFRRWLTALAVLALFAGLASAQVSGGGGGTALSCTASVVAPPQVRQEGLTELVGDIILVCSGGPRVTSGTQLSTVNITVSFAVPVTSRLLGNGLSEAMLMIDEPGSGLTSLVPGSGPEAAQTVCANQLSSPANLVGAGVGGCVQFARDVTVDGTPIQVQSGSAASVTAPANVFMGAVSGNQVIFNGIPLLAPGTTQATRYYRITNVRINANGLPGGLAGNTPVQANIAVSPTNLPIANPTVTAGFVQLGLTATAPNQASFQQCQSQNIAQVGVLRFTENFATAFKTRVAPTTAYNGQAGAGVTQNIPGTIYNSESGFINPNIAVGSITAGLADFGTRLKAVFTAPAGVRIFVSVQNLSNGSLLANGQNQPVATSTNSFALLVNGESTPDSPAGVVPTLSGTATAAAGMSVYEVTPSGGGGTGTAVWEVINTNPAQQETFSFGVWVSYTANTAQNLPAPGTAGTVAMSFAPTSTVTSASSTAPIPRFFDNSTARPILLVNICQTYLLFPFLTNQLGLDTGIAIANTSMDPSTIGTNNQQGICDMFFYGTNAPATLPVATPVIPAGTVYATLVSTPAAGFQGYAIARCNFQWAHGFAFISDIGLRNHTMGYLALVMNNGSLTRGAPAESLGN
jgi:hypothetical protein